MAPAKVHVRAEAGDQHQGTQRYAKKESRDHGKYWRTNARIADQLGQRLPPGQPPWISGLDMVNEVIASGLSKLAARGISAATRSRPMLVLISPPRPAPMLGTSPGDTSLAFWRIPIKTSCSP